MEPRNPRQGHARGRFRGHFTYRKTNFMSVDGMWGTA